MLPEEFIPEFNQQFSVEPKLTANLHQPLTALEQTQLPAIFSRQDFRTIQNDFTLSFNSQWYQITPDQPVLVRPKDRVMVELRLNESVHIRLRGKYLSYQVLPERPKKTTPKSWALTKTPIKRFWKPALDHPWRKSYPAQQILKSNN